MCHCKDVKIDLYQNKWKIYPKLAHKSLIAGNLQRSAVADPPNAKTHAETPEASRHQDSNHSLQRLNVEKHAPSRLNKI